MSGLACSPLAGIHNIFITKATSVSNVASVIILKELKSRIQISFALHVIHSFITARMFTPTLQQESCALLHQS